MLHVSSDSIVVQARSHITFVWPMIIKFGHHGWSEQVGQSVLQSGPVSIESWHKDHIVCGFSCHSHRNYLKQTFMNGMWIIDIMPWRK